MNKKERELVQDVYDECLRCEKNNDLTEFGAGQGTLAALLLDKKHVFRPSHNI